MKKILILILLIANCFVANAQFKGGDGDGFAGSPIFAQPTISIFTGGSNDGFATALYNQVGAPLPILIINFSGKKINQINILNWQTSQEINASHFEIEKSSDAKAFEKIGEVKADKSEKYKFDDQNLTPEISDQKYYRLKLVDIDGKYNYSKVVFISNDFDNVIVGQFYPNPTIDRHSNIDILTQQKAEWVISTVDILGKIIKSDKRVLEKGLNTIQYEGFKKGLNLIQFESNGIIFVRKITE